MELAIGKRFKDCYETRQRYFLQSRVPVMLRLDGNCFSNLTQKLKCEKPFDMNFSLAMENAAIEVCKKFGAVCAFSQSDEITVLLLDDKTFVTQPFFDYEINKLVSISAATASVAFNKIIDCGAVFDSRAFNVPKEDVINGFYWRQIDCLRNARNLWAEFTFGEKTGKKTARKELHGLNSAKQIEKVEFECQCSFKDTPNRFRNGFAIIKIQEEERTKWVADNDTPWFIGDKKYLLDQFLAYYGEADKVNGF